MLANFEKLEKPNKFISGGETIKKELYKKLDVAVKNLVSDYREVPIAFSGGLDSSILVFLALKYTKPILFCIGYKDSYDAQNAQRITELLGLKLNIIYLDGIDLKKYHKKTIEIIGTKNKLAVDLNLPFYILVEELKNRGYGSFISGQGADTLFGGFAKYACSESIEENLYIDIRDIYKTNLQYNFKVGDYFGIDPLYPFLEKEVVELAVKISSELKIKDGVSKYILREAFRGYLPEEIINQNKKAFQYGSGISKALRKIKKQD
jgi:asparagine synthase (glutamine-hydrolysing)